MAAHAVASRRWFAVLVLLGFLLLFLVGMSVAPPYADATTINPVSGYQPKGTVTAGAGLIVSGTAPCTGSSMDASTARILVDGVAIPRSAFIASTPSYNRVYFSYPAAATLSDGVHIFRVEMSDLAGRVYAFQWSATFAIPPTVSWISPAKDAVVYTGRPPIVMTLADNTSGTHFAVTGQVRTGSAAGAVVGSFSGDGVSAGSNSFALATELPPGTYYLTASVTDGAGNTRVVGGTAARRFSLSAPTAMSVEPADCLASGCHVATGHPAAGLDCMSCHVYVYHNDGEECGDCHDPHGGGVVTVTGSTGPCTTCHSASYPQVPRHTAASVASTHDGSCGRCHDEPIIDRHAVTPEGSVYPNQCDLCHASDVSRVQDAVASGNASCGACHDSADWHKGYWRALHLSEESCLEACHDPELGPEHDALPEPLVCEDCHPAPVADLKPWDATCSSCHQIISHATADHTGTDLGVRLIKGTSNTLRGCTDTPGYNRGCHDLSGLNTLHARRSDKGCAVCHDAGTAAARDCISCHLKYTSGETKTGLVSNPVLPTGDGTVTAGVSVFPADPVTRWDKVDDATTVVSDYDGTYVGFDSLAGAATRSLHTFAPPAIPTVAIAPPANTNVTITAVRLYYRVRKVGTSTLPRIGASLNVGGTVYDLASPAAIAPAAAYPTAVAPPYFNLTVNPKTGAAWQLSDIVSPDGENGLREFGLYSSNLANPVRVTQCYLTVAYNVTVTTSAATQSNSMYHHNNVKYLRNPADAPEGQRWAINPPNGWTSVLFEQDCQDKCHTNYWGPATYSAYQGTYMWHSMAGAGGSAAAGPTTRTLTLQSIRVPDEAATLEFMTNWRLNSTGRTTSTGYVELSTDGGQSYTPLMGNVGGVDRSSFTENATVWVPAIYDLSAYAGQDVKLRFRYVVGTDNAAGWAFDDLRISGSEGVVFSDDAETLKPEWTNGYWNRSIGAFIYQ